MAFEVPRILLVDSYDSFSHNLAALCRNSIPNCQIHIIKNDQLAFDELILYLPYFSAIIVGPGPGSPDILKDIGIVRDLWKLKDVHVLPIFGVCLGLQSLSIEFGARLKRLDVVKHGQLSYINHTGTELFHGVGSVRAVRYHSLYVELLGNGEIEPLAWAEDDENGEVVMAVKHSSRPFWAVQYHPESVCTEGGGLEVLSNFWRLAQQWSRKVGRHTLPWNNTLSNNIGISYPFLHARVISDPSPSDDLPTVTASIVHLPTLSTVDVCEYLGACNETSNFVALDSAAHPGRFSIVGSLGSTPLHVSYYVGESSVYLTTGDHTISQDLGSQDIWQWLAIYMHKRKAQGGNPSIPFWGGFVGYLSYEMGYPTLQVPLQKRKGRRHPDINFVFLERSVVLDHSTGDVHVQSLLPEDEQWIQRICAELARIPTCRPTTKRRSSVLSLSPITSVTLPDRGRYISRINRAMEHLLAGDSYELCLTTQTRISIPHHGKSTKTSTSWERYKALRKSNPAPHSAYLRLHPTTLLSSSPERFLSFSRPPNSVCQLRPIKGTMRKSPGITRSVAEKALAGSAKEVAENLMIVDLIRHDLHGVLGDDVTVSKFCGVEEYETVWQLVSVIEGKQSEPPLRGDEQLGWTVLQRSLPPGSMTGAPKKRSVEILQNLEDGEREVYSGVFGYWCVSGGGDWSVTIRSCFKFNDLPTRSSAETSKTPLSRNEEWVIGAGGAITALSDAEAEWDEMILKLQSVLKPFGITPPMSSS